MVEHRTAVGSDDVREFARLGCPDHRKSNRLVVLTHEVTDVRSIGDGVYVYIGIALLPSPDFSLKVGLRCRAFGLVAQ